MFFIVATRYLSNLSLKIAACCVAVCVKCCFLQVVLAPDVVARTRRWVKGVKEVCTGVYLCQAELTLGKEK